MIIAAITAGLCHAVMGCHLFSSHLRLNHQCPHVYLLILKFRQLADT